MTERLRTLVIEDSAASRDLLGFYLEPLCELQFAPSLTEGSRVYAADPELDVVVLDLGLPESTGLATLERFRAEFPDSTVVVLTALSEAEFGEAALKAGAQDYVVKESLTARAVQRAVRYAAQRAAVARNRRCLEAHLLESRRLESLGRISAALAHELATPLQCIASSSRTIERILAKSDVAASSEARDAKRRVDECSKTLLDCVSHCMEVLESTRQLARTPDPSLLRANVADCVDVVLAATRPLWGRHAKVARSIDWEANSVAIAPTRLQQILFNLVRNAVQAVETLPNGAAAIELRVERRLDVVRLHVKDNGVGMSSQVRERAFEPFFTTRRVNDGTGVGLATVYALARAANGDAYVESEEGRGTTVTVEIPSATAA